MKNWIVLAWSLFIVPLSVFSSNIAIVDVSGDAAYLNSIRDRVLVERCFSEPDERYREYGNVGSDPDIEYYYLYRVASGCPNGGTTDTAIGSREVIQAFEINTSLIGVYLV